MNTLFFENLLDEFFTSISGADNLQALSDGIIGEGQLIPGLSGENPLVYADYVASGRALQQVESFVQTNVLPFYANSHTQASYCGEYITKMRSVARDYIAKCCNAGKDYSVIFTGSGSTNGINRLVHLLGVTSAVRRNENPLVVIGPYEHHSNILPWRESGAEVVELQEAECGGPDLVELERLLNAESGRLIVCAFSAASNVTGIISDVDRITALVHRYNALCVWDYAASGPYVPINMTPANDCSIDAIVVSCHKFLGGPGASGVLIVRNSIIKSKTPTLAGGGTVTFVSPWGQDYSDSVIAREEAGTPNIIGDIKAALCFLVKEAIGNDWQRSRQKELYTWVTSRWRANPNIQILGSDIDAEKLPIFSMLVFDSERGMPCHQQLFTRMLSDIYGIQARGGCACAGPYGHRLLNITSMQSQEIRTCIYTGDELAKPGWTRLNLSAVMSDEKVQFIIDSVDELARSVGDMIGQYESNSQNATFSLRESA